jgi:hypothetical protein
MHKMRVVQSSGAYMTVLVHEKDQSNIFMFANNRECEKSPRQPFGCLFVLGGTNVKILLYLWRHPYSVRIVPEEAA